MGPFESQCEQLLAERVSVFEFTKGSIKKLRTDYFAILRNLPRVKTQKDVEVLRKGMLKFRRLLESLFDASEGYGSGSIIKAARSFIWKRYSDPAEAKKMIDWRVGLLRKASWQLMIEFDIRFEPEDARKNRYPGDKNLYAPLSWRPPNEPIGGSIFDPRKVKNYRQRLGKKAKHLFDVLGYFLEWAEKQADEPTPLTVRQPVESTQEIEGFTVLVHGYDPDAEYYTNGPKLKVGYDTMVTGLRLYKQNAKKRYPELLRRMLPLKASFECDLGDGGRYENKFIRICVMAFKGNPARFAHVVAHEMGHHIYRTQVSSAAQKWWRSVIYGDYKELDLRKLLAAWGPKDRWLSAVRDSVRNSDPVLALQLDIIAEWQSSHRSARGGFEGLNRREEVEDALASGRKVLLPKHPITSYAHKNPEEAFCEIVGLWVAYGKKAVHPMVMANFKYILGL